MTETKHRRPARRTLAHGQPLRRPMARHTPRRRATAGRRPRPAVGRLWQLVVCGALLLGVVAIKLTAPDTLEPYRQRLLTLMGGDTDFTAAFSAVGHAFDGSLTGALDDAYTAVFGPRQAQPTAATYTAENTPEDVCLTQQVLGFAYAAPVQGTVTDGFGWRENAFHYGTDIAADAGTVISSFADGTVTAVEGDLLRVDTPAGKLLTRGSGFAVGEEMHVSIRPEYLEAGERSADGFDLPARIKDFTYMGTVVKTALDMADGTELKLSRFEQDANAHEGDKVYLSWRPEKSVPIKKSHT